MSPSVRFMLAMLTVTIMFWGSQPLRAQEPVDPVPTPSSPILKQKQRNNKIYLPLVTFGDPLTATLTEWPEDDSGDPAIGVPDETPWPAADPTGKDAAIATDALVQAAAPAETVSTIDSTEDTRALGYPDARKIVRNSQG
ncbi:MAG: hypothetical protein KDE47_27800, partial [Caldilineaceae bacterium]|nr:hypothetical protein [Caldilineaceae bacterium]